MKITDDKVSESSLEAWPTSELLDTLDTLEFELRNAKRTYSEFTDLLYEIKSIRRELDGRHVDY